MLKLDGYPSVEIDLSPPASCRAQDGSRCKLLSNTRSLGLRAGASWRKDNASSMVIRLAGLFLLLVLSGCQGTPNTFAGFTFGGGGNTFNCEPATWSADDQGFQLSSGDSGPTSISLSGQRALTPGETAELHQASIRVPSQGEEAAQLVSGQLVLQSQSGTIVHGSFDLTVKMSDGREFPVVGSFTAEHRSP